MKIGSIIQWTSNTIPDGFLLCDGSAVSRTTYAELFSVIGTTYGAGDGSTTFNVPNYKGRVGVGLDSNDTDFDTLGETLGEKTHTLTINEMPEHAGHLVVNEGSPAGTGSAIGKYLVGTSMETTGSVARGWNDLGNEYYPAGINRGNDQAHNIIQPSIVTNYIIKALNPDSIKISELESATNITSSDLFVLVQNNETKKITYENLLSQIINDLQNS